MALFAVEIRRLLARRAVVLLLIASVVVPAIVFASVAWETRPISAADVAEAERMVEQERQSPWLREELERCADNPEEYGVRDAGECEEMMAPQVDWYLTRRPLDLDEQRVGSGTAVLTFVALFLMLAGTTFAGADWNSGSMSNQLLFEPRRVRVWLAKAGAVLLVSFTAAAAVVAAYWGGLTWLANARDLLTTEPVMDAIVASALWSVGLVATAAVGCYALTMLFRHTVATVGVLFAVAVGSSILIGLLPFQGNQRWLLYNNVLALVHDGWEYYDFSVCRPNDEMCTDQVTLARGPAAAYLGSMLGLVLAASVWSFRRRDVP